MKYWNHSCRMTYAFTPMCVQAFLFCTALPDSGALYVRLVEGGLGIVFVRPRECLGEGRRRALQFAASYE